MGIFSKLFAKKFIDTEALDNLAIAIASNSIEGGALARKYMSFSANDELQKEQMMHVDFVFIYFLLHIASREYTSMFGPARNREFMNLLFPRIMHLTLSSFLPGFSELMKDTDSNEYSKFLQELLTSIKKRFDEYDLTYSKCKDIITSEMELYSDKSLFFEAATEVISQTDQKTEPHYLGLITLITLDAIKKVDFPTKLAAIG